MKKGNSSIQTFARRIRKGWCIRLFILAFLPLLATGQIDDSAYTFVHLTGQASLGHEDGPGENATFRLPTGVAVDLLGNVFIADTLNHSIRKVSPQGIVSTVTAWQPAPEAVGGPSPNPSLNHPQGVAVDAFGNVFVADTLNHVIRKISLEGVVSTFAGALGISGSQDGIGAAAFHRPQGIDMDTSGNLYVADALNHTIRKISPQGVVSTLAGLAGARGSTDGSGGAARFNDPRGVAVDGLGNVYVADTLNHTIRKISQTGAVSTFAGLVGQPGHADGIGGMARFSGPEDVAVDASGNVFVADTQNHTLRKITPERVVSIVAGSPGNPGSTDGESGVARFNGPVGIGLDSLGTIYVTDQLSRTLRAISRAGTVKTLAGVAGYPGTADGPVRSAQFHTPQGLAVGSSRSIYVADTFNHTIRIISSGNVVSTLAGSNENQSGSADGTGSTARFRWPRGLAVDRQGNVFVTDTHNHTLRKITPAGEVTTLAGLAGRDGSADGGGSAARLFQPSGLAYDSAGNIFVADTWNHTLRKVTSQGDVSTLAGAARESGSIDGEASAARFLWPKDVAVDSVGNIYVADSLNHTLRKITSNGAVTTLAGLAGQPGSADGQREAARFNRPEGAAVDRFGNIFVADTYNHTIRKVTPDGVVRTIAGSPGNDSSSDGTGSAARFYWPTGVAVDDNGVVYVADSGNHAIRYSVPTAPDQPQIDKRSGPVGAPRRLRIDPFTAINWDWTLIRRPAHSNAELSSNSSTNPTFVPDVAALYVFRLRATNAAGAISIRTVELEAKPAVAPVIIEQPQSLLRRSGEAAAFSITMAGAGPFTYQWRRNGFLLEGATRSTLTLDSVTESDAGDYAVEIDGGLGRSLSETARLDVSVPPRIKTQPIGQVLFSGSGQPLRLMVTAEGEGSVGYEWSQNGTILPGANSPVYEKTKPEVSDSGVYQVTLKNAAGEIRSSPVEVQVIEPARIRRGPVSQTVPLGQRVEFTVEIAGDGSFTYQWRHNGQKIDGATAGSFVIPAAGLADAGTYTVIVANEATLLASEPAELSLALAATPAGDLFQAPVRLARADRGTLTSTNQFATREPDEPLHAGKPGTHSVWFSWIAPSSGIAAFDTIGSAFDTLLAIYKGNVLNELREVVSDDDHGGFFRSEVRFNAVADEEYRIAVDGLGEASGRFVVSWRLQSTPALAPVLTGQPRSVTVTEGTPVTLRVGAANAEGYQWRFRGRPLPGETKPDLVLPRVASDHVGSYEVEVTGGGVVVRSTAAVVEIGTDPAVKSYDKLEELFALVEGELRLPRSEGFNRGSIGAVHALVRGVPPALLVSPGRSRRQVIDNTTATTQQGEVDACGTIGTRSLWIPVVSESGGVLLIDTPNAGVPVVMVLLGSARKDDRLACAVGERLRYEGAVAGRTYYLGIDGFGGASGTIPLALETGNQPPIITQSPPPPPQQVQPGQFILLRADFPVVPGRLPAYQWLHNGIPIPDAVGVAWAWQVRSPRDGGTYSIVIDNGMGVATNEVARVEVDVPLRLVRGTSGPAWISDRRFQFEMEGNQGQQIVVEQSADLLTWKSLHRLWLTETGQNRFLETNEIALNSHFFRGRAAQIELFNRGQIVRNGIQEPEWQITGGRLGQRYAVDWSRNGFDWVPFETNVVQHADRVMSLPRGIEFHPEDPLRFRVRILQNE